MNAPLCIPRPYPSTLALYRRAYRLHFRLKEPNLQRRFLYNVRELISLYARPEWTHPPKEPLEFPEARVKYTAFVNQKIQEAHQDLDLLEDILSSDPKLLSQLIQSFIHKHDAQEGATPSQAPS